MKTYEIRKEARKNLKGKWKKAVLITLTFMLFSFAIGFIQAIIGEEHPLYDIIDIAFLIINIPLSYGLIISFIKLKRGENVKAFDYFKEGFSRFKKAWGINLRILLKLLLPITLVFIIGFIILLIFIFALATAFTDTPTTQTNINSAFNFLNILLLLSIPSMIYLISKSLLYTLSYYISFDNPHLSSKECVLKSKELMKGNRKKYFLLLLTFLGWTILTAFTLGIGLLWLMPYIQIATICFYEHLINSKTENIEEVIKIKE